MPDPKPVAEFVRVDKSARICRLRAGECKRLPDTGPLIGWYVTCPVCGYKFIASAHEIMPDQCVATESAGLLSLSCGTRCGSSRCMSTGGTTYTVRDSKYVVLSRGSS